jgi:hypothetical protein
MARGWKNRHHDGGESNWGLSLIQSLVNEEGAIIVSVVLWEHI